MKVLGLVSSQTDPASRARIIQYVDYFKNEGAKLVPRIFTPLRDADPAKWAHMLKKISSINEWRSTNMVKILARLPLLFSQYGYDLIWQNRLLLVQHYILERILKKPVVFDYDDAIWINEGRQQVSRAISSSAMVFCGNEYLADYGAQYNNNVHIVPTTIDTDKLFPVENRDALFTLGWIGTKSNFAYLEIIRPALLDFLGSNKNTRFIVVSSEPPPHFVFDDQRIIFRTWSAEKENDLINAFSVGLMPLADTSWEQGKCSYKMLQYMACGKPVIVSPVGNNNKILSESTVGTGARSSAEWMNAFNMLKNDPAFYQLCATNARQLVETRYCCKTWSATIITLFNKMNQRPS